MNNVFRDPETGIQVVTEVMKKEDVFGGAHNERCADLTLVLHDFGFVSTGIQTQGWPMSIFDWNIAMFGLLIVVFLIFEPLGFFGIAIDQCNAGTVRSQCAGKMRAENPGSAG